MEIAKPNQVKELIGWTPPSEDWMTLNTDGAAKGCSGSAACGGLVRDASGPPEKSFLHNTWNLPSYPGRASGCPDWSGNGLVSWDQETQVETRFKISLCLTMRLDHVFVAAESLCIARDC